MAFRLAEKKKIALVLSGGGIKASAFHIGVCLALKEKGFKFAGGTKEQVLLSYPQDERLTIRLYVGSSAGAFVSAILSAGHGVEDLINAFDMGSGRLPHFQTRTDTSLRPISYKDLFIVNGKNLLFSFPRALMKSSVIQGGFEALLKSKFRVNGIFSAKGIEKYLREAALTHNEFDQLGVELFIVGTQLNHSRKAIFGNFPETTKTERLKFVNYAKISDAVAASVSLPPVFMPYGIDAPNGKKMYFFDGEIRDTLSTHIAADHGADLVISSYSVQPYHYTPEIGSLHDFGIPTIVNQALYQVIQQKIDRHITHQKESQALYASIDGYFKSSGLPDEHREKVLEIVRKKINFKPSVDYIYIHPRSQDYEMFFADHFSLNPQNLEKIVGIGFKSAIQTLRTFDI